MPAGVKQAQAGPFLHFDAFQQGQGLFLHVGFQAAAFAVEPIQICGQGQRTGGIGGKQTFNAQTHVRKPPSRVEAGANDKAQVFGTGALRLFAGHFKQGVDAGAGQPLPHACDALRDQQAVVGIQLYNIGHGA